MQGNERVVVIKGNEKKWYSQAVFIINPSVPEDEIPVDFVAEAEKIIYDYMAKKHNNAGQSIHAYLAEPDVIPVAKAKRRFPPGILLYILMAAACVGMAAIVAFGLLN